MTKKDMHLSTLARSFGIMTITVEDTGTAEEDSRSALIGHRTHMMLISDWSGSRRSM